jgi:general secretion pathway protein N
MTGRRTMACVGLVLLAGSAGLFMAVDKPAAQTISDMRQAAVDTAAPPRGLSAPAADPVQGGTVQAPDALPGAIRIQGSVARERELRGNPLWGIPLRSLTATRERPLFTPSRRPPAPAVAGPPPVEAAPPPPSPAGPDRPQLTLVGAISSETEGIAIFVDNATRDIVRLRTGESHSGWTLRSVKGREAALQKDQETVILALPAPDDQPKPPPNVEL